MSKRQFKSQASSSRAVSGGGLGGFGGFGAALTSSTLSYLTEPPNISSISDSNVIVCFKNLSKKDGTTKSKALEDLRAHIQAHPHEQDGGVEEAILEAWVKFYPRISIDNSRRVRELSHNMQFELLKSARKRMEKYILKVVGSWLAGTYDRDRAVSRAAMDGITSFLDTNEKMIVFWKRCQVQILEYAQEAINETPQTLSDERTMTADDVQAKYFRVVGSSISLVVNLLVKLGPDDILKYQDKYDEFLSNNKSLWALSSCEDSFVRRTIYQLLEVALDQQRAIVEADLELISHAFIAEALRASQSSSAFQLVQALKKLTSLFGHAWTSAYKGKRSPFLRLRHFIEKGSQGGPPAYWQSLESLISVLPAEILPIDKQSSLEFLNTFRSGIGSRDEPKNNTPEAWSSYFATTALLLGHLSQPADQAELFQNSVYPVFEQYLHPTAQNSKWSIGNSTAALAKAYNICACSKEPDLQKRFSDEWHRLADDFIQRLNTSLPERSKDYHKSQSAVLAESHRWFALLGGVLRIDNPDTPKDVLVLPSNKIIKAALAAGVTRNGKLYSAAATIEAALRFAPELMRISSVSLEDIKSFLESHLPKLIMSPSSTYLISIQNLFRLIPDQQEFADNVWQSTIDGLLPLPDNGSKSKVVAGLISNDAVASLAQDDPALQDFVFETTIRVAQSKKADEDWSVFEAAVTYSSLTEATGLRILEQVIHLIDSNSENIDGVLIILEAICRKQAKLLRQERNTYVVLITKLLALTELSDAVITPRASRLKAAIEQSEQGTESEQSPPILHVIRENLETATPQSLSIETLVQQAKSLVTASGNPSIFKDLLPNTSKWQKYLDPLLAPIPNPALGVMRPFAGAVFLVRPSPTEPIRKLTRDLNGYSVPLRMALYNARLIKECSDVVPNDLPIEVLYLQSLTAQLVQDQIDSKEQNLLFSSILDPDVVGELLEFLSLSALGLRHIFKKSNSWLAEFDKHLPAEQENSSYATNRMVSRLLQVAGTNTSAGFYAARILSSLLQQLVEDQGWNSSQGELWLQKLDILKPSSPNILGACALLIGLQECLGTSKIANNLCNRLVSDVAGASAQSEKTLGLLVLLNASFCVYQEGDLPVAQNRLVFAVKQILSWTDTLAATNIQLTSEACHALHRLLPAIKDVYGTYWDTALTFCISIWNSGEEGDLAQKQLPMVGMSLKLYTILRGLKDANDDLEDSLKELHEQISHSMIKLLKLRRLDGRSIRKAKESAPLVFVDDLLSREIAKIPLSHVKDDLSDFYPLVASDFRNVQSAAFDVLHRALPEVQEQLSVDVLLEKKDAQLPEELLSLLLDAPSFNDFPDEILVEFPTSIRGYLLSWLLVYDSYSKASFKVRNDYSDTIKSEDYIGPLLAFVFDVLGHSSGHPVNLSGFDTSKIRSYDMWGANDVESNEQNMHWLLVNLYYLCLKFTPSLAKNWWMDCKSKQTRIAVESWTEKFFSPLVIQDTMDEVSRWAETQETTDDEKELIVKVSKKSREVFAGYEVDDMMMQIAIRLPSIYPLEGVKVDGINRVAVSEKKWTSWMMITQGVITFSNGSITDGLITFRKNVTGALKGQSECAICYSIISSDKKMPDKRCQTCKNLFHASCLFKWFASSNQSTCPLCRNPFHYGTETTRRARAPA